MDAKPRWLVLQVGSCAARGWFFVGLLAVLCAAAGPAAASFPGRNGTIVYGWVDAQKYSASPTSIRAVNPRSGRVRVLRDCPVRSHPVVAYTDCHVSVPRYSPDGLRIAFPTVQTIPPPDSSDQPWQFRPSLGMMASDGTGLEERASPVRYDRLAWSPAGDQFLLQRSIPLPQYSQPSGIFLASLDGIELMQATPEWTQTPDWSTTGEIAFGRYTDPACLPGCEEVWVTRVGAMPRQLTYRGGFNPSWSPHGTKLAFARWTRKRSQVDVYLIRRDGRGLHRLTYRGGLSPSWSPDGKWIAFIRANDLYVVRTSGRGLRRLVNEPPVDEVYGLGPKVTSIDWQALPRR